MFNVFYYFVFFSSFPVMYVPNSKFGTYMTGSCMFQLLPGHVSPPREQLCNRSCSNKHTHVCSKFVPAPSRSCMFQLLPGFSTWFQLFSTWFQLGFRPGSNWVFDLFDLFSTWFQLGFRPYPNCTRSKKRIFKSFFFLCKLVIL